MTALLLLLALAAPAMGDTAWVDNMPEVDYRNARPWVRSDSTTTIRPPLVVAQLNPTHDTLFVYDPKMVVRYVYADTSAYGNAQRIKWVGNLVYLNCYDPKQQWSIRPDYSIEIGLAPDGTLRWRKKK